MRDACGVKSVWDKVVVLLTASAEPSALNEEDVDRIDITQEPSANDLSGGGCPLSNTNALGFVPAATYAFEWHRTHSRTAPQVYAPMELQYGAPSGPRSCVDERSCAERLNEVQERGCCPRH